MYPTIIDCKKTVLNWTSVVNTPKEEGVPKNDRRCRRTEEPRKVVVPFAEHPRGRSANRILPKNNLASSDATARMPPPPFVRGRRASSVVRDCGCESPRSASATHNPSPKRRGKEVASSAPRERSRWTQAHPPRGTSGSVTKPSVPAIGPNDARSRRRCQSRLHVDPVDDDSGYPTTT